MLLVTFDLVLGLAGRVEVAAGAPRCPALAGELGVVGGLGGHLGEEPSSGWVIKPGYESGIGSRVEWRW